MTRRQFSFFDRTLALFLTLSLTLAVPSVSDTLRVSDTVLSSSHLRPLNAGLEERNLATEELAAALGHHPASAAVQPAAGLEEGVFNFALAARRLDLSKPEDVEILFAIRNSLHVISSESLSELPKARVPRAKDLAGQIAESFLAGPNPDATRIQGIAAIQTAPAILRELRGLLDVEDQESGLLRNPEIARLIFEAATRGEKNYLVFEKNRLTLNPVFVREVMADVETAIQDLQDSDEEGRNVAGIALLNVAGGFGFYERVRAALVAAETKASERGKEILRPTVGVIERMAEGAGLNLEQQSPATPPRHRRPPDAGLEEERWKVLSLDYLAIADAIEAVRKEQEKHQDISHPFQVVRMLSLRFLDEGGDDEFVRLTRYAAAAFGVDLGSQGWTSWLLDKKMRLRSPTAKGVVAGQQDLDAARETLQIFRDLSEPLTDLKGFELAAIGNRVGGSAGPVQSHQFFDEAERLAKPIVERLRKAVPRMARLIDYPFVIRDGEEVVYAPLEPESPAGLEEVREFGSVEAFDAEAFLQSAYGKILWKNPENWDQVRSLLRTAETVTVLRQPVSFTENVILYHHTDWGQAVEKQLRSNFVLPELYPTDGRLEESRVVILRQEERKLPADPKPSKVPQIVVQGLPAFRSLTPGFVYTVAVDETFAGQVIGPIIGVITFKDEQGRILHAVFA